MNFLLKAKSYPLFIYLLPTLLPAKKVCMFWISSQDALTFHCWHPASQCSKTVCHCFAALLSTTNSWLRYHIFQKAPTYVRSRCSLHLLLTTHCSHVWMTPRWLLPLSIYPFYICLLHEEKVFTSPLNGYCFVSLQRRLLRLKIIDYNSLDYCSHLALKN